LLLVAFPCSGVVPVGFWVGASGEQASDHDCENFAHWIDSSIENWLETPPGEQKVSH